MPILNAKIILASAALFSAPAMAQTGDDVQTVKALVNMVTAEKICGFPMRPDIVDRLLTPISSRIPPEKAREFGYRIRLAGEAQAEEMLSTGNYGGFCAGMADAYAKIGAK